MKKIIFLLGITLVIFIVFLIPGPTPPVIIGNTIHVENDSLGLKSYEIVEKPSFANIYIDASGSMKGYFLSNDSGIINTVSKLHGFVNERNIFFIGNRTPYEGLVAKILGSVSRQPNNATTTFHDIFSRMGKSENGSTLSFLVTDGIMSIDKVDMANALVQLKNAVRDSLKQFSNDKAIAVYKYTGYFKGNYWDKNNHDIGKLDCNRPYYVIALGSKSSVRYLRENENLLSPEKSIYFGIHDIVAHNMYEMTDPKNSCLEDIGGAIVLDATLPKCFKEFSTEYLIENLKVIMNRELVLTDKCDIDISSNNLKITVDQMKCVVRPTADGDVLFNVTISNPIPSDWISFSCLDDTHIREFGQDKTFGLESLLRGIKEGIASDEKEILSIDYQFKL